MTYSKVFPLNTFPAHKYVVTFARYRDKWLFSRHRSRTTWETQGGHIEPGETPLDAARRELYEESGVTGAQLYYVCDYHGYTDTGSAEGAVFLAVGGTQGPMPDSEMAETALFAFLPENLTYPLVTPRLMKEAGRFARAVGIAEVPTK